MNCLKHNQYEEEYPTWHLSFNIHDGHWIPPKYADSWVIHPMYGKIFTRKSILIPDQKTYAHTSWTLLSENDYPMMGDVIEIPDKYGFSKLHNLDFDGYFYQIVDADWKYRLKDIFFGQNVYRKDLSLANKFDSSGVITDYLWRVHATHDLELSRKMERAKYIDTKRGSCGTEVFKAITKHQNITKKLLSDVFSHFLKVIPT